MRKVAFEVYKILLVLASLFERLLCRVFGHSWSYDSYAEEVYCKRCEKVLGAALVSGSADLW